MDAAGNVLVAGNILVVALLFTGFLWIRSRSRSMNVGAQPARAVIGVYILLPALLIGEKFLIERWHFGPWTDLLLKVLILPATFLAVGLLFLKKDGARV